MKAQRGSRCIAALSLILALEGSEWSKPRPCLLYSSERPGTDCTGGWVSPRASPNGCGKISPPPEFVQPVASGYTEYAVPVHF